MSKTINILWRLCIRRPSLKFWQGHTNAWLYMLWYMLKLPRSWLMHMEKIEPVASVLWKSWGMNLPVKRLNGSTPFDSEVLHNWFCFFWSVPRNGTLQWCGQSILSSLSMLDKPYQGTKLLIQGTINIKTCIGCQLILWAHWTISDIIYSKLQSILGHFELMVPLAVHFWAGTMI